MKSLELFSKSTTCQRRGPFIKRSWTTFYETLSLCSQLGVPSVFCIVDKRSSWVVKFFWESWGSTALSLACGSSRQTCPSTSLSWPWGLQVGLQQPTTSPKKHSYCQAIWSSQIKSESIANLMNYFRKNRYINYCCKSIL